jgi:outer membrane murein-binding lipoprotein Lpp
MSNLPTNYVDDVLNADVNTRRKYQMIQNSDGTVSFNDVTDYDTVGSSIGAAQINAQNTKINQNSSAISTLNADLGDTTSKVNNIGTSTLLATVTNQLSEVNLSDSLANYRFIYVTMNSSQYYSPSVIIPTDIFRTAGIYHTASYYTGGGINFCTFKYVNDTKISFNDLTTANWSVYGIK